MLGDEGAMDRQTTLSNSPRAFARDHPLSVSQPHIPMLLLGPILPPSWHGQSSDVAPCQMVCCPTAPLLQETRETALHGAWARRSHRGTPRAVAGCHRGCGWLFSDAGSVVLRGPPSRVLAELNVASRCPTSSPIVAASATGAREGERHAGSR